MFTRFSMLYFVLKTTKSSIEINLCELQEVVCLILAAAPFVGFSSQEVEQLDKKGVEEFIDFCRKKGILGKYMFKNCSVQCRNGGRH